jgi:citronellol/citronellal dehydrogenase
MQILVVKAGGKCLPCVVDIRDEKSVDAAVDACVQKFGQIDVLINNASAISLTSTLQTPMKRFDLMHQVNTRGTFMVYVCACNFISLSIVVYYRTQKCLPYMKNKQKVKNPHILNISPPLNMNKIWFSPHVGREYVVLY